MIASVDDRAALEIGRAILRAIIAETKLDLEREAAKSAAEVPLT